MTAIDDTAAAALTAAEESRLALLDAYRALNELIGRVPLDIPIADWRIHRDGISAMHNKHEKRGDDPHATMRRLAAALGFERTVRPHDGSYDKISVLGSIDGVRCEIWVLVKPCHCTCHAAVAQ